MDLKLREDRPAPPNEAVLLRALQAAVSRWQATHSAWKHYPDSRADVEDVIAAEHGMREANIAYLVAKTKGDFWRNAQ